MGSTYSWYSSAHGKRLPLLSIARSSKGTPWNCVGKPGPVAILGFWEAILEICCGSLDQLYEIHERCTQARILRLDHRRRSVRIS